MNIIEKKKNPLFGREEIVFEIEQQKTPSFAESEELLQNELKLDKNAIAIKQIKGLFGYKRFRVKAFLYDSNEEKQRIEPKKKVKKIPGEAKVEAKKETK